MADLVVNPVTGTTVTQAPPPVASSDGAFEDQLEADAITERQRAALLASNQRVETQRLEEARTDEVVAEDRAAGEQAADEYYTSKTDQEAYFEGILQAQALVGSNAAFLVVNADGSINYERLAQIIQQQLELNSLSIFNESNTSIFGSDSTGLMNATDFYGNLNTGQYDEFGVYDPDGEVVTSPTQPPVVNLVA